MSFSFSSKPDLELSHLESTRSIAESQEANLDVAELDEQINDLRSLLATLRAQIRSKEATHRDELEMLRLNIKQAKIEAQDALEEQENAQEEEIHDLMNLYAKQIEDMKRKASDSCAEVTSWNNARPEVSRILSQIGINDAGISFEQKNLELIEFISKKEIESMEKKTAHEREQYRLIQEYKELEREVDTLGTSLREKVQEFKSLADNIESLRATRTQDHNLTMTALQSEYSRRQDLHEKHVKALTVLIDSEKSRMNYETEYFARIEQKSKQIKSEKVRSYNAQLSRLMKDIEHMHKVLSSTTSTEEGMLNSSKGAISKEEALRRENALLQAQIAKIENELETLLKNTRIAQSTMTRIKDATKTPPMTRFPYKSNMHEGKRYY